MGAPQKKTLQALAAEEQQQLERLTKASSERIDVVRRAKALLALADGRTLTETGGRCFGTAAAAITDQIGPFPTFVIAEQHSSSIQGE